MKRQLKFLCLSLLLVIAANVNGAVHSDYRYETVPNDPLKARIYTLNNGLKVYMTVNKQAPRIQTYIAVRVGGKNDPAETTGLAHYFEHLMFKGTKNFGTQDYAKEKPLLDMIEQQFEIYRKTTDEAQRKAIYKTIDSISYEASKISIPNEYDKLMSAIGANGTNAWTSFDETVYVEDIPSNQIENWAKIQSDRFSNAIIRGFHTELETVYEEKNMSLTKDGRKVNEKILACLFPNHPYGTQTVLGTQENLKNPSITNIKNYYNNWYVSNNIAICLSGDFNPDEMIATIDNYFGSLKPNPNIKRLDIKQQPAITSPIVSEVVGPDAENITIGWRFPGASSKEVEILDLISQVLYNGQAGLIDLNINQKQALLFGYGYTNEMADHSVFILGGQPKTGQTLDDVKNMLLEQIKLLKAGKFDESLLQATINNFKYNKAQQLERNSDRAQMFVSSFINGTKWADEVGLIDRLSKITKKDIVDFANKYFLDTNYAVIYKKQGKDLNEKKISKPQITPICTNRDAASSFLKSIQQSTIKPIEPVFVDYQKDMKQLKAKSNIPVLYKQNLDNNLFELVYLFDMGKNNDKWLGTAFDYMDYLGTSKLTPEQLKKEFYRLACSFRVISENEKVYVVLTGLKENMPQAVSLFEKLLTDAKVNKEAYSNMINDVIKNRSNAKLNQGQNFNRLVDYAIWGAKNPSTNIPSAKEMQELNPQALVDRIHSLNNYKHTILYYGPNTDKELVATINKLHVAPAKLKDAPAEQKFEKQLTQENKIYIAPYEAKQIYMTQYSNNGEKYNASNKPLVSIYNEYFGGGMNSIVFQEMREARGLAYTARAYYVSPNKLKEPYYFRTMIATQNDKMIEAIKAFGDIINNMPQSEAAFSIAKEGVLARLRTERIIKSKILWSFIEARELGEKTDTRKALYEAVQKLTLQDIVTFQKQTIKDRKYTYCILGDEKNLEMDKLGEFGNIQRLSTEDIFGY